MPYSELIMSYPIHFKIVDPHMGFNGSDPQIAQLVWFRIQYIKHEHPVNNPIITIAVIITDVLFMAIHFCC